jgi:SAM-dependent methyltransferase
VGDTLLGHLKWHLKKGARQGRLQLVWTLARVPFLRQTAARLQMHSVGYLHRYWSRSADRFNDFAEYADAWERSEVLGELLPPLDPDARILEVGCCVGRNLAYLRRHGYSRLEGIEINPNAVEHLRVQFPELEDCRIHVGSAEEVLPTLVGTYDLVFTMAVLIHIHPSSRQVFDEMARLGDRVLCIEAEESGPLQFPHDIERNFISRGFRLVDTTDLSRFETLQGDPLRVYVARLFERT